MSRRRFSELQANIRFDDITTRKDRTQNDKLAPFREFLDRISERCKDFYKPSENLTIDEQLVRFFGHCRLRVYMPSKPDKYGIKIWVLADAANAYCLNFQVYTGKPVGGHPERNLGQRVVLELSDFLPGGYNITTDNFFTSVPLANALLNRMNPMTILGTLKKNKPDVPSEFIKTADRQNESSIFGFTEKLSLVSYCPRPRKLVLLLSSMHHDADRAGEVEHYKPKNDSRL